ncbi:hypothetical protein JFL43_18325 [Viridibacillus sp. YIM B01967]|uniref:Uncharacterized protein n=1 Tax=Viridibacillus soli TaxID=2798301 RepID=A0ABS1HBI7_9BACL|nr:hypothetical protein [Viridibacillus soli]MBK3496780.1 hypothetical protein [Viridibacillus soli]
MAKVATMDKYLDSYGKTICSSDIFKVVNSVFEINLDKAPILTKVDAVEGFSSKGDKSMPRVVMDSYLNQYDKELTGADIRGMINEIFGVNLEAISSLEGARISLYSKDQWVVQYEKDLFVVHTGTGDVDVKIYPTSYFTEQTGVAELPTDLQNLLTDLGYSFNEEIGSYYFLNPTGEAISDVFKGQTMGVILKVIHQSFTNL